MPCFYLTPEQYDFNNIPELQVCTAEALYDIESILADPSAYPEQELCRLRDHSVSNSAGKILFRTSHKPKEKIHQPKRTPIISESPQSL